MSKREPLLSDGRLDGLCHEAGEPNDQPDYCGGPGLYSATLVRAFYEDLIDSGKLRVVVEVEFVDNDYDANVDCNRCGWSICYIHIEDNPMTFCPGCGNPIKR